MRRLRRPENCNDEPWHSFGTLEVIESQRSAINNNCRRSAKSLINQDHNKPQISTTDLTRDF
jgi:hypothetical protein